jgi:hypothetical protein
MNVRERVETTPVPARRGSLALGIGLAWAALVAGYAIIIALSSSLARAGGESWLTLYLMPWIAAVLLLIAFVGTGRSRTAIGMAIGLGSVLVIGIVLFFLIVAQLTNNFR